MDVGLLRTKITTCGDFENAVKNYGRVPVCKKMGLTEEEFDKIVSFKEKKPFDKYRNIRRRALGKQYCKKKHELANPLGEGDYYEVADFCERARERAERKNEELVYILAANRENFANIGTNRAKRRLNSLVETNDIAKALRIALEIEDYNIKAKKYLGKYRDKNYNKKEELIYDLIDVFKPHIWEYGIQNKNEYSTSKIIYFEIPGCEQISWHCNISGNIRKYPNEWDKKKNKTLDKLSVAVYNLLLENNLIKPKEEICNG